MIGAAGRNPSAVEFAAILLIFATLFVTRLRYLAIYNDPTRPQLFSTFAAYLALADALRHGYPGHLDLARLSAYAASPPFTDFRSVQVATTDYVPYYTLDIGYMFLVYVAQKLFFFLPRNHTPALALQVLVDASSCMILYYAFRQWSRAAAGAAAFLYASSVPIAYLVAVTFYYFWDVPFTFLALLALYRCLAAAGGGLARPVAASLLLYAVLAFAVWVRSTWWILAAFLTGVLAVGLRRRARTPLVVGLLAFGLLVAPHVYRASTARGGLALSTRASWHVALVGLGAYPNPYGIEDGDDWAFMLSRQKHGVPFVYNDYGRHDAALRADYIALLRSDPAFVLDSWSRRLIVGLLAAWVASGHWPLGWVLALAVLGSAVLLSAGGARRGLGIGATGLYVLSSLLTSVTYYVQGNYFGVQAAALVVLAGAGVHVLVRTVSGSGDRAFRTEAAPRRAGAVSPWAFLTRAPKAARVVALALAVGGVLHFGYSWLRTQLARPSAGAWRVLESMPAEDLRALRQDFQARRVEEREAFIDHLRRLHPDLPQLPDHAFETGLRREYALLVGVSGRGRQHRVVVSRHAAHRLSLVLADLERFVTPDQIAGLSALRFDDHRYYAGTAIQVNAHGAPATRDLLKASVTYVDYHADARTGANERAEKLRRYADLVRRGLVRLSLAAVSKFEKHGFAWGGFETDEGVSVFYFRPRNPSSR